MRTNRGAAIGLSVLLGATGIGWMGSKDGAAHLPTGTPRADIVRGIYINDHKDHDEAKTILKEYNVREHVREHATAGVEYERVEPKVKEVLSTVMDNLGNMPSMEGKSLDQWGEEMEAWGQNLEQTIEKKVEGIEPEADKYKHKIENRREKYIQEHLEKNGKHEEARERRQEKMQMHLEGIEEHFLKHYESLKDKDIVRIEENGKIYEIPGPVLYEKLQPLVEGSLSQIPDMLSEGFANIPSLQGKSLDQWGEEMGTWGENFGYGFDKLGVEIEKEASGLEEWIRQYEVEQ